MLDLETLFLNEFLWKLRCTHGRRCISLSLTDTLWGSFWGTFSWSFCFRKVKNSYKYISYENNFFFVDFWRTIFFSLFCSKNLKWQHFWEKRSIEISLLWSMSVKNVDNNQKRFKRQLKQCSVLTSINVKKLFKKFPAQKMSHAACLCGLAGTQKQFVRRKKWIHHPNTILYYPNIIESNP